MDSLKAGWRGTEFAVAVSVVALGAFALALGYAWPGMVGAALASAGYGVSRGLAKAAYTQRGGSASRTV